MNKVIVFNQNNAIRNQDVSTPVQISILKRYEEKATQYGGELPLNKLHKFLAGENARVLAKCREDGSLDDQTLEECKVFAAFYIKKISQETKWAISNEFGGLPFFLQAGVAAIASTQSFPWNIPSHLSPEQMDDLGSLIKIVDGMDANRLVSFNVKNPNGEDLFKNIALSADMSSERMQLNRKLFIVCAGYMIQLGGRLILRQYLPDGKFVIMGFSSDGKRMWVTPAEKLKEDFSKSPKCSEVDLRNMEFVTPILP